MNRSNLTQQKLKAVLLFLPVLVVIILTSLSMRSSVKDMDQAMKTVYQDRLQPAIEVLYLSENLHTKRHLLDIYLGLQQPSAQHLKKQLKQRDDTMRQILHQFEKTVLVKEEVKSLESFKTSMSRYAQLEQTVVQLQQAGRHEEALELFNQQGAAIFQQGVNYLHELAQIQATVGQQTLKRSHSEANHFYSNSTLQVAVTIIIAVIILSLINNVKRQDQGSATLHLN
ncbi:chemoreceptor-like protein with four helix bundle sensory module [Larkinella arboricola]|uniref:Chemoreceptor-like protein with four helix bundle sensory module n=1 Tax=Larkinella arboricola TaxID=643671 RepID=A0A327WPI8_LARAB|nr:MCP four helix bundle domain-containing protein [Larkinella arboricola]RAJ94134.1 chemoreceptor-like protein with four helix bundle sensory module [Larkinella arboricola]